MEQQELIELTREVQQFVALKDQSSQLTSRQNEIKKRLQQVLKTEGTENDKGHLVLEINDEVSGVESIVNQKRVSKSLDLDVAEKILLEKNLFEQCVVFTPELDESAIMAAFYEGKLTEEDIDAMFPSEVTWAFTLQKK
jgi:hypothetical protein